MTSIIALLFAAAGAVGPTAKPAPLAPTPPMGWNSWNKLACDIDEQTIRAVADAMVASGMKDAGYQYLNLDDCWQGERDRQGFIQPDAKKFPSGIKALADYVHGKGLKLGIYSDAGAKTCGGRAGSRGHEYQDALNRTARPQKLQLDWKQEKVVDALHKREAKLATTTYAIRDLWSKQRLGTTQETLNVVVPSHDVLMVRLEKR
jgi:hypothetical protein